MASPFLYMDINEIEAGLRALHRMIKKINGELQQKNLYRDMNTCEFLCKSLYQNIQNIDAYRTNNTEEHRCRETASG